jgi:hypothetical protein
MGHAMTISTGKRWLVLLAFFIASWPGVIFAETSALVNILKFQLTCDLVQCRTPVLEVHENNTASQSRSAAGLSPLCYRLGRSGWH